MELPSGKVAALDSHGFTLLELLLATLISTLVIGILSVSLTFSLKMWERQRGQKGADIPRIMELLECQLATLDTVAITMDGQSLPLFLGDQNSVAFATDYSVKALSRGVPVVARYVYVPAEKILYYAEIPLDPYHPETIREFVQMNPDKKKSWPRFFSIKIADFSLSYKAEETASYTQSWENGSVPPQSIVIKWSPQDAKRGFTAQVIPGFLFPLTTESSGTAGSSRTAGEIGPVN